MIVVSISDDIILARLAVIGIYIVCYVSCVSASNCVLILCASGVVQVELDTLFSNLRKYLSICSTETLCHYMSATLLLFCYDEIIVYLTALPPNCRKIF